MGHEVMENSRMSKRFIHKGTRTEYMVHNQGGRHTRDQASGEKSSWKGEKNWPWNHVHISMEYMPAVIKRQRWGNAVWFGTSPDRSCMGGCLGQRRATLGNRVGRRYRRRHPPSQSEMNSLTSSVVDGPSDSRGDRKD